MHNTLRHLTVATVLSACALSSSASASTVIELTQLPCQFLESEAGINHGFRSASAEDCKQVNSDTAAARLQAVEPMVLKPGKYLFRVTNQDVPYALGFWLRGEGLVGRATLPNVSGGGMTTGTTLEYEVELKPGRYLYSCPLNPTPDYRLVVRE
ncbi:MAG: hypothetical protein ACI9W6_000387 [Motiliproteus sp.]|jgi:hypothetical protein